MTRIFPTLVGVLEFAAATVYATQGDWIACVVWACYGVAAVLLGLMR